MKNFVFLSVIVIMIIGCSNKNTKYDISNLFPIFDLKSTQKETIENSKHEIFLQDKITMEDLLYAVKITNKNHKALDYSNGFFLYPKQIVLSKNNNTIKLQDSFKGIFKCKNNIYLQHQSYIKRLTHDTLPLSGHFVNGMCYQDGFLYYTTNGIWFINSENKITEILNIRSDKISFISDIKMNIVINNSWLAFPYFNGEIYFLNRNLQFIQKINLSNESKLLNTHQNPVKIHNIFFIPKEEDVIGIDDNFRIVFQQPINTITKLHDTNGFDVIFIDNLNHLISLNLKNKTLVKIASLPNMKYESEIFQIQGDYIAITSEKHVYLVKNGEIVKKIKIKAPHIFTKIMQDY